MLLFPPIFSFQQFFYFCSIFCSSSRYFSTHKRFFLVHLQLLSMYDCCIRVIHNMVTALLEYVSRSFSCFPEVYVELILFVTILTVLRHPFFQFFTYFSGILLFAFSLLFSKKIAGKIGAALVSNYAKK